MNIPNRVINEFQILLTKSLEYAITDAEIERLHTLFHEYPKITSFYHRFITLNLSLKKPSVLSPGDQFEDSFYDLLTELAKHESTAPQVERQIPIEPIPEKRKSKASPRPEPQPINPTITLPLLAAVCMLLLVILIVTSQLHHQYTPVEVATVTDLMDTQGNQLTLNGRLTNKSDPITLRSGVVKILFDCGVRIVVEGPAQFKIESAKHILLNRGKLYAQVSPSGHGFQIDTPNSTIVDLGTEFGIDVPKDQTSSVHMINGKATVEIRDPNLPPSKQFITEGQARRVNPSGTIDSIEIEKNEFIRDFDSVTQTYWRGEWLTLVPLPARHTDQASGISASKTYTHLLNIGIGQTAVINGVEFSSIDFSKNYYGTTYRDDSLEFTLTRHGAHCFGYFQNLSAETHADGGMQILLSDAIWLGRQTLPDYYTLTLSKLIPGKKYSLRIYYGPDHNNRSRLSRVVFNGEGHDREIQIDQVANGANYIRYDYTAKSNQVEVTFYSTTDDRNWHLYGISNEVIPLKE